MVSGGPKKSGLGSTQDRKLNQSTGEYTVSPENLFNEALVARKNAHAPYSNFLVGAALITDKSDTIYSGCNVENLSYGATICAERTAIVKAISELPGSRVKALALVTDAEIHDAPCGLCLQVMSEFCEPETPVHLCNLKGIQKTLPFKELMPFQFENNLVGKS